MKEIQGQKIPEKKVASKARKRAVLPQTFLRIRLARSLIGCSRKQRQVVRGLGLRKLNSVVVRKDCPEVWGMVRKIPHLLRVEVLKSDES